MGWEGVEEGLGGTLGGGDKERKGKCMGERKLSTLFYTFPNRALFLSRPLNHASIRWEYLNTSSANLLLFV